MAGQKLDIIKKPRVMPVRRKQRAPAAESKTDGGSPKGKVVDKMA